MSDQNPLMIDLVLETLFQYSDQKDLNQFRLVCKKWHTVSLPFWAKKYGAIRLTGDDLPSQSTVVYKNFLWEKDRPWLSTFLSEVHPSTSSTTNTDHSSSSPFEFAGLRKVTNFDINILTPTPILDSFWESCGPRIRRLKLDRFNCKELALLEDIVCSKFTPNLEELSLDVVFLHDIDLKDKKCRCHTDDDSDQQHHPAGYQQNKHFKSLKVRISVGRWGDSVSLISRFPLQWSQILALYPNMEPCVIVNCWRTFQTELNRILGAILEIREKNPERLQFLKSIDMLNAPEGTILLRHGQTDMLDPSVLELLRHPLLTFSSLGLRFEQVTDQQVGILRDILHSQTTSLKKLSFFMATSLLPTTTARLGVIPHLEVLHAFGFPFSSFSFLRSFPNLRSLKLRHDVLHGGGDEGPDIVRGTTRSSGEDSMMIQLPYLTEFECTYRFGGWAPDALRFLHQWTPNISILKMILNEEDHFSLICQHFPNMEEMVVWGLGLTDRSIAGCTTVGNPPNAAVWCFNQHNITVFHRLKSFEMDVACKRVAKGFSLLSVIHGFAKLPELRRLEVNSYAKIQPSVIDAIKEHTPFAKIIDHW